VISFLKRSLIALLALLSLTTPSQAVWAEAGLRIYFLDVGQGDASIAVCDGVVMMIDGGDPAHSQYIYSFLRNTLGISDIEVMIASHPHSDHVGGLAAALNACSVGVLYTPELDYDTKAWQSVIKYANAQGTPILIPLPGDEFDLGGASVQILGPLWHHNDINNMSLIVKICYGNTSCYYIFAPCSWQPAIGEGHLIA